MGPLNDFQRRRQHIILRALARRLCGASTENAEISKRERDGAVLSLEERSRRDGNHLRMNQIEDLILKTGHDIVFERA